MLTRLVVLAASFLGLGAALASPLEDPYEEAALPQRGAYFDREKGGAGILVDHGLGGGVFVALFLYAPNGAPTFYTLQGAYEPTPRPDAWRSETVGRLRSPLYLSSGGECLGCPYRAPVTRTETAFGSAELTWRTARHATLVIGAQRWNLEAIEPDGDEAGLADGRWLLLAWESGAAPRARATVDITPRASLVVELEPVGIAGTAAEVRAPLPPANALFYDVLCVEDCVSFDQWRTQFSRTADVVLWYEHATGRAGLDQVFIDGGRAVAPYWRRTFEVFLQPEIASGRATRRTVVDSFPVRIQRVDGATLKLVRLPPAKAACPAGFDC